MKQKGDQISKIVGLTILAVTMIVGWKMYDREMEEVAKSHRGKYMESRNRLDEEKSPYLLQHKDNPVHWYAWGEDAFNAAKAQDKPIFLSIGYSTCHWCHVMAHDSFEKQDVADILNENFINIKVDREERPDVDQIYMDAVVAMTGRGGWPLSVFLTPDKKPFFGATFFWKDQFKTLLGNINEHWKSDREKLNASTVEIMNYLKDSSQLSPDGLSHDHFKKALEAFKTNFDEKNGGFGDAPKFPRSTDLSLLMRLYSRTKDDKILRMVEVTLDKMARGGIYDHLGGGFARYATDRAWMIPHFEKMLYDNALLALTYTEAYQLTHKLKYKMVAEDILNYILRDMTHKEGAFYSAEDADSEGVEGKFYVFEFNELKNLLTPDELDLAQNVFGVTPQGNFEGKNVLYLTDKYDWDVKLEDEVSALMSKLKMYRDQRVRPHLDDKILTAWNGLMIGAMAKAGAVFENEKYINAARQAARFIQVRLNEGGKLFRRYRDGDRRFEGVLNDYSYLIYGLTYLYEATYSSEWIYWALELQGKQDDLFWDANGGYQFASRLVDDLIVSKKDFMDNATPAGNSVSYYNLTKLYHLTFKPEFKDKMEILERGIAQKISRYPPAFSMGLIAYDLNDEAVEIAVLGEPEDAAFKSLNQFLRENFFPHVSVAASSELVPSSSPITLLKDREKKDGKTTSYICQGNVCQQPTTDIEEIKKTLYKRRALSL